MMHDATSNLFISLCMMQHLRTERIEFTITLVNLKRLFHNIKLFFFFVIVVVPIALMVGNFYVPMLCCNMFYDQENVFFILWCLELVLAFCMDELPVPTKSNAPQIITKHERYEQSNCMSLIIHEISSH